MEFRRSSLEDLDIMFHNVFDKRRVLITGHSGFKGAWLKEWLELLGADVYGLSLPLEVMNQESRESNREYFLDIRDRNSLSLALKEIEPEIIFHLAAQSIVSIGYEDPLGTWETNVMGTGNILEECRTLKSLKFCLVVTSDKCYQNNETGKAFTEDDVLGGHDPYSASKAGAEIISNSYRNSYFLNEGAAIVSTARAGNVIGGGDWATHRLVPDFYRSVMRGKKLSLRNGDSTRPWQHVLDSLSGYLLLAEAAYLEKENIASAWNFGSEIADLHTVKEVVDKLNDGHNVQLDYLEKTVFGHEAAALQLNSSKAKSKLGWQPVWDVDTAIAKTIDWYQRFIDNNTDIRKEQIYEYQNDAIAKGLKWATND
jgi:CDP-glucose 4,6-dehydratase